MSCLGIKIWITASKAFVQSNILKIILISIYFFYKTVLKPFDPFAFKVTRIIPIKLYLKNMVSLRCKIKVGY